MLVAPGGGNRRGAAPLGREVHDGLRRVLHDEPPRCRHRTVPRPLLRAQRHRHFAQGRAQRRMERGLQRQHLARRQPEVQGDDSLRRDKGHVREARRRIPILLHDVHRVFRRQAERTRLRHGELRQDVDELDGDLPQDGGVHAADGGRRDTGEMGRDTKHLRRAEVHDRGDGAEHLQPRGAERP